MVRHCYQIIINKLKAPSIYIAVFYFFGLMNISISSFANFSSLKVPVDTTIDTIHKPATIDSNKLFTSLLALPGNNNEFNVAINPEAKLFVDDYIKKHTNAFNNMKVWGKPYFDLYDKILSSYGVPVQLKYLSVIESSLNCTALSYMGAVGPWQIMADAAREHGLRVGNYDDRLDYAKSTTVAAQILKELYNYYNDWLLVIAAYNCGKANVDHAIFKARSNNFWNIQYYLPQETRNHVKKFIATHYYFEGDGGIATLTNSEAQNAGLLKTNLAAQIISDTTTININGKYNSAVIADNLGIDVSTFKQLNPNMDNILAKGQTYAMHIPSDKADLFQSKKPEILKQSVELLFSSANTNSK